MSIRLNKVTRNLNVGLSTVVAFLQKKGFPTEESPNTKIEDEAYELLIKEFNKDKTIKLESEKMSQERLQKEKKETVAAEGYDAPPKAEEIKTEIPEDIRPKFVTVGKIDLDIIGKKNRPEEKLTVPPVEEPEVDELQPEVEETATVPEKEEEIIPAYAEEESSEDETVEEFGKTEDAEEEDIEKYIKEGNGDDVEAIVSEEDTNADEESLTPPRDRSPYRVNTPNLGFKFTGEKIDLNSINQSTRPKKKTKEERRRERAEKEKKAAQAAQIKKTTQEEAKVEKKNKPVLIKKSEADAAKKKNVKKYYRAYSSEN